MAGKQRIGFDTAARILGINQEQLEKLVSDGELRAYREDKRMVFERADVEALATLPNLELIDLRSEEEIIEDSLKAARADAQRAKKGKQFSFVAMDATGREVLGQIRALSVSDAADQIRARNLFPTTISPVLAKQAPASAASAPSRRLKRVNANMQLNCSRRSQEAALPGGAFACMGALLLVAGQSSAAAGSATVVTVGFLFSTLGVLALLGGTALLAWRWGTTLDRNRNEVSVWCGPGFPLLRQTAELEAFDTVLLERTGNPARPFRVRLCGAENKTLEVFAEHKVLRDESEARSFAKETAELLQLKFDEATG